jgi:hypothetical protein
LAREKGRRVEMAAQVIVQVNDLVITHGSHTTREDGMCAMEAVAWLAGEPHSDKPICTCPVIGGVVIGWNDSITDDETRTRLLRPLLLKLIGTRVQPSPESDAVLLTRMYIAVDWQIRTYAPAFLRAGGFLTEADALSSLSEIVDAATLDAALPAAQAAENAAGNAAENAAYNAAVNAAENAAENAAYNAAENAAYNAAKNAAVNAAKNAAKNAAGNAAGYAAENAAENAAVNAACKGVDLGPVVAELQASAVKMIERMCAVGVGS